MRCLRSSSDCLTGMPPLEFTTVLWLEFPNKNNITGPKVPVAQAGEKEGEEDLSRKNNEKKGRVRKSLAPRPAHGKYRERVREEGSRPQGVMEILRWLRASAEGRSSKKHSTSCCAFNREISGHPTLGVADRSPSFESPNCLFRTQTRRQYPRAHHFAFGQGMCLLRLVELLPDPS